MSASPTTVERDVVRGRCWLCGSESLRLIKPGNLPADLSADNFKITDSDYGKTADIFGCGNCGFRQALELPDVLRFYAEMSDDAYENGREARAIQARMLLQSISSMATSGRLLDVGAGTGILVEEAMRAGFDAEGIEPSGPLSAMATARGLRVHHGTLPMAGCQENFDIATVIDVIEHVSDPVGLMRSVRSIVKPGGLAVVVTPDVNSMMARLLRGSWWHYRIAHIGYFNRETLALALRTAGFEPLHFTRPAWYFPASYLVERVCAYLPKGLRFKPPSKLDDLIVPLNLLDSLQVVARRL